MRLWLDGQCFQTASRLRGIGRYALEFMTAIATHHPDVELVISFNASLPNEAIAARETVRHLVAANNIHLWHGAADAGEAQTGFSEKRRLSEAALCYHVDSLAPDIALSTSPFEGMTDLAVPLFPCKMSQTPIASIFYDAIPYRFAEHYLATDLNRAAYMRRLDRHRQFDLNLCISEFSSDEINAILPGANAINISTGVSPHFLAVRPRPNARNMPRYDHRFLLCVGGLDWRKNVSAVVDAYRFIPQALRQDYRLVIVGDYPSHLCVELEQRWAANGLPSMGIVFPGHVSESELFTLYEESSLLIQPSFMEGFGLTAVEAMMCGTPVIAARAGALPEVVGDERLLFDPQSPREMAHLIERILGDDAFRADVSRRNRQRAGKFSWERTASLAVTSLQARVERCGQGQPRVKDVQKDYATWASKQRFDKAAPMAFALAEPPSIEKQTRLIIDATSTMLVDHKTGIQRVVNKICQHIFDSSKDLEGNRVLSFCDDSSGFFDGHGDISQPARKSQRNRLTLRPNDHVLMLDSSWTFHEVHRPFFRAARLRGASVTSCLYDLVPLRTPGFCDSNMPYIFGEWLRTALSYSTGFVCISRAVADELYALLCGIDYPRQMKIGYWRLGADFVASKPSGTIRKAKPHSASPDGTVFLMVGTLEPRKGHQVAIDAFERLWANDGEGSNAQLVIVGKKGWGVDALAEAIRSHSEFGRRLIWHASVSDTKLADLYANCDALLSSSFAEGFGLPLVEAAHFGKPVIASDIPVFREVADPGTGAEFFTVGSSQSLYEVVRAFIVKQRTRPNHQTAPKSEWPTWADSARELETLLVNEDWYKIYEPTYTKAFIPLSDIGAIGKPRTYKSDERSYRLELVGRPTSDAKLKCTRYLVKLTNLSHTTWLGQGDSNGMYGVALSYHVLAPDGTCLVFDNPRTRIPFVIIPGETKVLTVEVPMSLKETGAGWVELELVQEGCDWWGGALRVAL